MTLSSEPNEIVVRSRQRRRKPAWQRKLRHWLKLKNILLAAGIIAVVLTVSSLVLVTDATNRVQAAMTSLQRVISTTNFESELTLSDYERLRGAVGDLENNLISARNQLRFLRPFAGVNQNLGATLEAMEAAVHLSDAGEKMLRGLQPAVFFLLSNEGEGNLALSSSERLVELLRVGQTEFASAEESLVAAREIIAGLSLGDLAPDLVLNFFDLTQYADNLSRANAVLRQSPDLLTSALGLSGTQTYLILSQNSDELRPSGGYIGTYGWMTVRNGQIVDYQYSPTTATSPNPPPALLAGDITIPDWWLQYDQPIYAAWDGSWSADFGATAERASWFYNQGNNPQAPVHGVIGIDIIGFERILAALGSVVVPGYPDVITPANFRQVVYGIRESNEGDTPHKRFIARLYQQIFTDWQAASVSPGTSARILNTLLSALSEKHIMLYFANPELENAVRLLGWAGEQQSAVEHDYLMVVDANLGNKSNRSINRQVTYDVDIGADGTLHNRVAVMYEYLARTAENDPAIDPRFHGPLDYNNLLQVFAPASSILAGQGTEPRTVTLPEHTNFVARVRVPYDSSERFQLTYQTPALVREIGNYRLYRLLLQKQPGTAGDSITVQVMLPAGTAIVNVEPEPAARFDLERTILEFRLPLVTDRWIEIIYSD